MGRRKRFLLKERSISSGRLVGVAFESLSKGSWVHLGILIVVMFRTFLPVEVAGSIIA